MLYLVPDWPDNIEEQTLDPMTNLIDLLQDGKKPEEIIVLNFLPSLRYFLNTNELLNSPYWNVWDTILDIKRENGMPLGINEVEWPAGSEVTYSITVDAYQDDQLVARANTSEEFGYITSINFYNQQQAIISTDLYDDRGFKAATIIKDGAQLRAATWYNESGTPIVDFSASRDNQVQILNDQARFERSEYLDLNSLIAEFVKKYFEANFNFAEDGIIGVLDSQLYEVLASLHKNFPINYLLNSVPGAELVPTILKAQSVYVNNQPLLEQIKAHVDDDVQDHIKIGYPFSTDLQLGNSNEEPDLIIYWALANSMAFEDIETTSSIILDRIFNHDHNSLIIKTTDNRQEELFINIFQTQLTKHFELQHDLDRQQLKQYLTNKSTSMGQEALGNLIKTMQEQEALDDESEDDMSRLQEVINILNKLQILANPTKHERLGAVQEARIVVNTGAQSDTLVQMNAISTGIPIISDVTSPLIDDEVNGWIIQGKHGLAEGLVYFLDNLTNWNRALVASIDKLEYYSTDNQANWWEGELVHGR